MYRRDVSHAPDGAASSPSSPGSSVASSVKSKYNYNKLEDSQISLAHKVSSLILPHTITPLNLASGSTHLETCRNWWHTKILWPGSINIGPSCEHRICLHHAHSFPVRVDDVLHLRVQWVRDLQGAGHEVWEHPLLGQGVQLPTVINRSVAVIVPAVKRTALIQPVHLLNDTTAWGWCGGNGVKIARVG